MSDTAQRPAGDRAVAIGVFASGGGTNLQALLDQLDPEVARVTLVLADRPDARALERGRAAGARTVVVPMADRSVAAVADEMIDALRAAGVRLVALAGFIRKVPEDVVRRWNRRILNVHPALLPSFPGLAAQRQAFDHGVKVSGATVHLVDEGLDSGPIVAQEAVAVLPADTAESLAARILEAEHRIYPRAVRALARGRVRLVGRRAIVEDE